MEKCVVWQGDSKHYQQEAVERYVYVWQAPLGAYSFVRTTCGERFCLNVDHMQIVRPRKLEYPYGVCVYCGVRGSTRDHIEPKTWTGSAARAFVVTVPSCGECNSMINDSFAPTIPERREIAHTRIRKKYKRILNYQDYSEEEINEFEGMLREAVISGLEDKKVIQARLAWPEDSTYDLRALEKSGLTQEECFDLLTLSVKYPSTATGGDLSDV